MSFNKNQFRDLIDRTLALHPDLVSESAVRLLLGTAAHESHFGTFLRQRGGGPALGVFQMEPATFNWLRDKFVIHSKDSCPELAGREAEELEWDLQLSILMARLRYRAVSAPLPEARSVQALAAYWKQHYNTPLGAGTVEEFQENYKKYVE